MNFNFLSLFVTFLSVTVMAAPSEVDGGNALAKRTSGQDFLGYCKALTPKIRSLNTVCIGLKGSSSGPSDEFHSAASDCQIAASSVIDCAHGLDIHATPIFGLVGCLLELVACVLDLVVTLGLWILSCGLDLVFDAVKLVLTIVTEVLECIQLLCGGNWAYGVLTWPCGQALRLCKNLCTTHGITL